MNSVGDYHHCGRARSNRLFVRRLPTRVCPVPDAGEPGKTRSNGTNSSAPGTTRYRHLFQLPAPCPCAPCVPFQTLPGYGVYRDEKYLV